MTESHNVELSHKLSEQESSSEEHEAWEKVIEIRNIRYVANVLAFALLVYTTVSVVQLPRT